MKKLLGIIVLGLLLSGNAYASKSLSYGNYKKDPNNKSYIEHLKSVESGISWMNIEVDDQKIYCQPEKLEVTFGNIITAIDLGIKDLQSINYTKEEIDKVPIEFIMIKGLRILFPCK